MKIYVNGKELGEIDDFFLYSEGRYFNKLYGIDILTNKHLSINPVYKTLLKFNIQPGLFVIKTPWLALAFMERYPFIFLEKPSGEELKS